MDDEQLQELTDSIRSVGRSITPCAVGGTDATGGHVESLTEAAMGITAGLCRIADAIEGLAQVMRRRE